ncbi:MAG: sulfotransferase [Thiomargarita sp.]|nr:sulfotransferase [Thiomargarita sp.]
MKNNQLQNLYPIFCRGHSGGRLICDAFIRNKIDMGKVAIERKDTSFFSIRNPIIREIILNAYDYQDSAPSQQRYYQDLMRRYVTEYRQSEIQSKGHFGWKLGITLFTLPVVLDAFPNAKVIHLIRDGRDVMLSRLEARFAHLDDLVNRLVVFGDATVDHFEGLPLTSETIATYRNELEIRHWVTAVKYGLKGRAYNERYLEVKYEEVCQNPIPVFSQIFDFIEVPFLNSTKTWLAQAVYNTKMDKWKSLPEEKLKKPLEIAGDLLGELGYL